MNIQFSPKFAGVFKECPPKGTDTAVIAMPDSHGGGDYYITGQAKNDFVELVDAEPRDNDAIWKLMQDLIDRAKDKFDPADLS